MNIKQIQLAINLSKTLHFGKTAELANMAQSGLSAQIKKLESELGFRLFNRTSHKVELTEAGIKIIEHFENMLKDMDNVVFQCQVTAKGISEVIKIGFFGDVAGELAQTIFTLYRKALPHTQVVFIELQMDNQVEALIAGNVDAAFIRLPINDERLDIFTMFDEPRVAVVPSSHEMADAKTLSADDLFDKPFAVARKGAPNGWASYWSLDQERSESSRVGAYVNSITESMNAVAYAGAFDTYPLTATRFFSHPGICYIPLKNAARNAIALVTINGNRSPKVEILKRCINESLQLALSCVPLAQGMRNDVS